MRVRFLTAARDEMREAAQYFNAQRPGLGREFRAEVRAAVGRIRRNPAAWQSLTATTRRCQTDRFSYGVIYQVREAEILIVAVAHLHRRPEYWTDRD